MIFEPVGARREEADSGNGEAVLEIPTWNTRSVVWTRSGMVHIDLIKLSIGIVQARERRGEQGRERRGEGEARRGRGEERQAREKRGGGCWRESEGEAGGIGFSESNRGRGRVIQ